MLAKKTKKKRKNPKDDMSKIAKAIRNAFPIPDDPVKAFMMGIEYCLHDRRMAKNTLDSYTG